MYVSKCQLPLKRKQHLRICILLQNKNILTISVLTCAKDGTLNIPWMSSGGLLTPNHKNMFRPLANRNIPSSERRLSEQRIAAGNVVLLTSNVCYAGKGKRVRNSLFLPFLPSSLSPSLPSSFLPFLPVHI